jgi:hypothetical protein
MLQQGKFAADVCFYLGERPPLLAPPKYLVPSLGAGFDCDYANPDVLLHRMSVSNGRIVLPDGMSYRLLVLQNCTSPSQEICDRVGSYQSLKVSSIPSTEMSVEVVKKLRELILAGATVVGPPPAQAAGLRNYPECDAQLKEIASEIWGDLDGTLRTERRLGKGRIIWGKTAREILLADGVTPDFTFTGQPESPEQFDYIHRTTGEADIYFVINRTNQPAKSEFTFRVSGKQPEIWDPATGKARVADAYHQANASTVMPLELDGFGSVFVVFRNPVPANAAGPGGTNFPELKEVTELNGSWEVSFDTVWGGPAAVTFPRLISWTDRPENGIKYYSGTATYRKTFDQKEHAIAGKKLKGIYLDLGRVDNVAEVRLNGTKMGVLWCAPWRVEISEALRPTGNMLEVDIINLWANRVIGDLNLPAESRYTKTHDAFRFDFLTGKTPLIRSGLLGPVRILTR